MSALYVAPRSRRNPGSMCEILNEASSTIPAGAGELVQGQLYTGEDFLVTNPIQCFSTIHVRVRRGSGIVTVSPSERTKVKRAVAETLRLLAVTNRDIHVDVTSDIPIGKGMASSTADIVGAVEATAKALKYPLTPEQVSQIAISVEPSDGLMYRGVVAYNHRRGQVLEHLGCVPPVRQLIVDTGGSVDTIAFNRKQKNYTREEIKKQERALCLVREGIATSNILKIGEGATLSAQVNQRLLPKPHFEAIVHTADTCGACGVTCAHSGTILALLFTRENTHGFQQALTTLSCMGHAVLATQSIHFW